ncbi:MAG: hypothetical protein JW991_00695 [Candidatus Pacebacteria bacterium]|nr:hypothetical protein [Candidatus Paceibacterota bacterium]
MTDTAPRSEAAGLTERLKELGEKTRGKLRDDFLQGHREKSRHYQERGVLSQTRSVVGEKDPDGMIFEAREVQVFGAESEPESDPKSEIAHDLVLTAHFQEGDDSITVRLTHDHYSLAAGEPFRVAVYKNNQIAVGYNPQEITLRVLGHFLKAVVDPEVTERLKSKQEPAGNKSK